MKRAPERGAGVEEPRNRIEEPKSGRARRGPRREPEGRQERPRGGAVSGPRGSRLQPTHSSSQHRGDPWVLIETPSGRRQCAARVDMRHAARRPAVRTPTGRCCCGIGDETGYGHIPRRGARPPEGETQGGVEPPLPRRGTASSTGCHRDGSLAWGTRSHVASPQEKGYKCGWFSRRTARVRSGPIRIRPRPSSRQTPRRLGEIATLIARDRKPIPVRGKIHAHARRTWGMAHETLPPLNIMEYRVLARHRTPPVIGAGCVHQARRRSRSPPYEDKESMHQRRVPTSEDGCAIPDWYRVWVRGGGWVARKQGVE